MSKKRNQLGTTIDSDIHELVKDLSNSVGIPVSKLTDQAFGLLLDKYEDGGFVDPRKRTDRNYRFSSMDEVSATAMSEDFESHESPQDIKYPAPLTNEELDEFFNALKTIRDNRTRIAYGIDSEESIPANMMMPGAGKTEIELQIINSALNEFEVNKK